MSYSFSNQQLGEDCGIVRPKVPIRTSALRTRRVSTLPITRYHHPTVDYASLVRPRRAYSRGSDIAAGYDGLGFSLKPPKWLRKLQPGKVLKKALPFAAGAAALFIPGVGPAIAGAASGLLSAGRAAAPLILRGGKALVAAGRAVAPAIGMSATGNIGQRGILPLPGQINGPVLMSSDVEPVDTHPVSIVSTYSSNVPTPGRIDYSGLPGVGPEGSSYPAGDELVTRAPGALDPNVAANLMKILPWAAVAALAIGLAGASSSARSRRA